VACEERYFVQSVLVRIQTVLFMLPSLFNRILHLCTMWPSLVLGKHDISLIEYYLFIYLFVHPLCPTNGIGHVKKIHM
jgi:hypothetical protein